jgi:hypothetical protein
MIRRSNIWMIWAIDGILGFNEAYISGDQDLTSGTVVATVDICARRVAN